MFHPIARIKLIKKEFKMDFQVQEKKIMYQVVSENASSYFPTKEKAEEEAISLIQWDILRGVCVGRKVKEIVNCIGENKVSEAIKLYNQCERCGMEIRTKEV